MKNNNDFEGIKFTEKQIEKLKQNIYAMHFHEDIKDFIFENVIFGNDYYEADKFVVCPENRTINYMNAIYRIFYNKKDETFENKFFTASNYLAHIPMFCDYFIQNGTFPSTTFFDDIIWYGYDINELYGITLNLIREYLASISEKKYILFNKELCRFNDSLSIRAYGNRRIFDHADYYHGRLATSLFKNSIIMNGPHPYCRMCYDHYDSVDGRIILCEVVNLIDNVRLFSTTNSSLSLYEKNDNDNIHTEFSKAILKCKFIKWEYGSSNEEIYIRPLKDNNGNIFAFYTLTLYQNKIDNRFSITPYIIMADFKYEKGSIPLFDSYRKEYEDMSFLDRNKAEALYLILNYNLLLLISKVCDNNFIEKDRLDIDKIRLNFQNKINENEDLVGNLIKYKEPIWTFEEMDKFIFDSTKNSTPLFSKLNNTSSKDFDAIKQMVELPILYECIKIESCAQNKLKNQIKLDVGVTDVKVHSIYDILEEARKLGVNSEMDAINFIGQFVESTNKGDIDTRLNRDKDTYQYTYRVG